MTIHVHQVQSVVGPVLRRDFEVTGVWTARSLREELRDPDWHDHAPIAVLVGGIKLSEEDLDSVIEDGADVVITPDLQGLDDLASQFVLAGVNLHRQPRRSLTRQLPDLEDRSSPTYLVGWHLDTAGTWIPDSGRLRGAPDGWTDHRAARAATRSPSGYGRSLGQPIWSDWIHCSWPTVRGRFTASGMSTPAICGEINDLGLSRALRAQPVLCPRACESTARSSTAIPSRRVHSCICAWAPCIRALFAGRCARRPRSTTSTKS
jgi:hypothetical protein